MVKQIPTDELLFLSFYELCQKKPIEKITIDDIVKNCGMKRGIFYYYYKDKSDMINSNIHRITELIHRENYGKLKWEEIIALNCEKLYEYKAMYSSISQNRVNTDARDKDFFYSYIYQIVKAYYGSVDDQMRNIIVFYCGGAVELINSWIRNGYSQSTKKIAHDLVTAINPRLLAALNNEPVITSNPFI